MPHIYGTKIVLRTGSKSISPLKIWQQLSPLATCDNPANQIRFLFYVIFVRCWKQLTVSKRAVKAKLLQRDRHFREAGWPATRRPAGGRLSRGLAGWICCNSDYYRRYAFVPECFHNFFLRTMFSPVTKKCNSSSSKSYYMSNAFDITWLRSTSQTYSRFLHLAQS